MEVYINHGSKRASLLNINLYISHNNFIRIIYSLFTEKNYEFFVTQKIKKLHQLDPKYQIESLVPKLLTKKS